MSAPSGRRVWLALGIGGCALFGACRQTPAQQSAERARRVAALATTPEQARLWRDAADHGLTPGLQRLPVVARPVQQPRGSARAVSQQVPAQPVVIPDGVVSAVRVLAAPPVDFDGSAAVVDFSGDRLELDLGRQQTLRVLARVGGKPILTRKGERVRVLYQVGSDPRTPRTVVAIRTDSGNGILSLIHGGDKPVTASVPLFRLSAKQVGQPPSMRVDVGVGSSHRTMTAGETAQVGGLTVTLLGSSAHPGENAGRIEGSAYSINLIGWRSN